MSTRSLVAAAVFVVAVALTVAVAVTVVAVTVAVLQRPAEAATCTPQPLAPSAPRYSVIPLDTLQWV